MRTVSPIVYASVAALLLACPTTPDQISNGPMGTSNLPGGSLRVSPAATMIQSGQIFMLKPGTLATQP